MGSPWLSTELTLWADGGDWWSPVAGPETALVSGGGDLAGRQTTGPPPPRAEARDYASPGRRSRARPVRRGEGRRCSRRSARRAAPGVPQTFPRQETGGPQVRAPGKLIRAPREPGGPIRKASLRPTGGLLQEVYPFRRPCQHRHAYASAIGPRGPCAGRRGQRPQCGLVGYAGQQTAAPPPPQARVASRSAAHSATCDYTRRRRTDRRAATTAG